MYGELASVQGIVDLSPQEALDRAEGFLASQGYIIGQRTYTTISAQRHAGGETGGEDLPNLTVALAPQPDGGVRITVRGNDQAGVRERQAAWIEWSESLPKKLATQIEEAGERTVEVPDAVLPPPPQAEADVSVPPAPQAGEEHKPRISLGQFVVGFLVLMGALWLLIPTGDGSGSGGGNGGGGDAVDKVKQKDQKVAQQEKPQQEQPRQEQAQNQEQQPRQQGGAAQEPEPQKATFSNGTYLVGTDIQPGTYRTREGSPNCYYERLRNFSGGINSILANANTYAPAIVTIRPSDAGFNSQGCATWTKDLSAITAGNTSFGAGAYIVGTDMVPGTYRNSGGHNCYYERLRDFTGGMNSIIANGNTNNPTIVTIAPTDAGFQSQGCGRWTKLE